MIKWVRLDERMIHGQVATKWSRTLGVDRIVVADDTGSCQRYHAEIPDDGCTGHLQDGDRDGG